jgi:hypothetical protein
MPAGTPRGFNLQQFGLAGMTPMQNFGQPGGFAPFFAGAGQIASVWGNNGDRGSGPIRRGGRQYQNNTRTGPYDRRPRDPRFNQDTGRLSPPPGSRRGTAATGNGRWGDGAGGPAPVQAVQGRSLKSYEDLDAVAGGGAGELNY